MNEEDQDSEDSDFIDNVLASLDKDKTVRK